MCETMALSKNEALEQFCNMVAMLNCDDESDADPENWSFLTVEWMQVLMDECDKIRDGRAVDGVLFQLAESTLYMQVK